MFHVNFNSTNFTKGDTLEQKLNLYLSVWEKQYSLPSAEGLYDLGDRFVKVLEVAHFQSGRRAVVLIDEYDKPILDVLDVDADLENKHFNILKAFYSVFKGAKNIFSSCFLQV